LQKQVWTINKLITWAIEFFKRKNISNPRLSAELLLSYVLGFTRMELYLHYNMVPEEKQLKRYRELILKRLENVPIQYLTKEAFFRKLKLFVDERVLIPRPETELLVDEALEKLKILSLKRKIIKILEVGIGSGAVSLSIITEMKKICPEVSVEVMATEISAAAIEVADRNAKRILGEEYPAILKIFNCNILPENNSDYGNEFSSEFDMVIANPPYIKKADFENLPEEVKEHEPREALVAGSAGTEVYSAILERIHDYMNREQSFIIFETDPLVCSDLKKISENRYKNALIEVKNDYNDLARVLIISL
jgi:release factor glutamine methyltransferase